MILTSRRVSWHEKWIRPGSRCFWCQPAEILCLPMGTWHESINQTWLIHSCEVVFFRTSVDPNLKKRASQFVFFLSVLKFTRMFDYLQWFLSLISFFSLRFSQLCANSISGVLQRCCCDVCLRYIRRKLQQLRHSPHYINPHFILKCVPACLALQNVQGKGICFFPVPPSQTLSLFSELTNGEMAKARRWWWGGMTNGLWAVSREGRRCQSHESVDACACTPPHSRALPSHNSPLLLHLSLPLPCPISLFEGTAQTGQS